MGATVGRGVPVYRDLTASSKLIAADADLTVSSLVAGITLCGGVDTSIGLILTKGLMTIGATVVAGQTYYLAPTGGICLFSDLGPGDFAVKLGIATSTTIIDVQIELLSAGTIALA